MESARKRMESLPEYEESPSKCKESCANVRSLPVQCEESFLPHQAA